VNAGLFSGAAGGALAAAPNENPLLEGSFASEMTAAGRATRAGAGANEKPFPPEPNRDLGASRAGASGTGAGAGAPKTGATGAELRVLPKGKVDAFGGSDGVVLSGTAGVAPNPEKDEVENIGTVF
jgi:hypothetical protein